jgi:hypothetical protein
MDITLSPSAVKYLRYRQVSGVTFYLVDIECTGCIGAVREVGVSLEPPGRPENFRYGRAEGFDIYVGRKLKVTGPVMIKKQGFWKFSSLFAHGLQIPI